MSRITSKTVQERQQMLHVAEQRLKEEFIGIDEVIDSVISSLHSWYFYPELQEKPLIINLWGMTGVGKTALVRRLSELLGMDERFFRFEMGEKGWNFRENLEQISDLGNNNPFVLALDEFQQGKSKEDNRLENEPEKLRVVWEVLDSGVFSFYKYLKESTRLAGYLQTVDFLIEKGLRIEQGSIVQGKELFEKFSTDRVLGLRLNSEPNLLDDKEMNIAHEVMPERFGSSLEVEEAMYSMGTQDFRDFLGELVKRTQNPKMVDCRKALVFVIGNLDEVYKFGNDEDPEVDADDLHQRSLRLTVPDVKWALLKRFRREQVARLGNTHILYPSLSSSTFQRLIGMELERIRKKVRSAQGLELSFDDSIKSFLYSEGVYPLQGTRPLFSTVQEALDSKLGYIISQWKLLEEDAANANLRVEQNELVAEFRKENEKLGEVRMVLRRELGKLKDEKQDDNQAVVAAHEAGHAVLGMLLLKQVPERILSSTIKSAQGGNVQFPDKKDPFTKRELEEKGKVLLGGLAAEEMLFGEEDVTPGSGDDLQRASKMSLQMIKEWGMGTVPGSYYQNDAVEPDLALKDTDLSVDEKAKEKVIEWKQGAKKKLEENWEFFVELAARLSDERKLERDQVLEMTRKFEPELYEELRSGGNGKHRFRQRLKLHLDKVRDGREWVVGKESVPEPKENGASVLYKRER
ncbi:MAG: hypothetical protein ABEH38_10100 [Flavobacteriales bacterium]